MFNAISRHELRDIVKQEFPHLEAYVDSLYENDGVARVKLEDGTWQDIPVTEGFSQGCPLSPILAAIVLSVILKKLDKLLRSRADKRRRQGELGDDNKGGITIIMAYVDDANFLVPHEDVLFLLQTFQHFGTPLGAVMNTEKTRILTSTSGTSILPKLLNSNPLLHNDLQTAISTYSTKKDANSIQQPHEVCDGLRILGVPIGSQAFCINFIHNSFLQTAKDATKVLEGLSDKQTRLRIFKMCTLHKMTHLFASEVHITATDDLPDEWDCWESPLSTQFTTLISSYLQTLLNTNTTSYSSLTISTLGIRNGGLGLQHPKATAIPTFVLTTKRSIDYAINGIYLPSSPTIAPLPECVTTLYHNWHKQDSHIFNIFNKYAPQLAQICHKASNNDTTDPLSTFINATSIPYAREEIKFAAGQQATNDLLLTSPPDVAHALPSILENHTSLPLIAMNRSAPIHRMPNDDFDLALKRKLRIPLWNPNETPLCICGDYFDNMGDHALKCTHFHKSKASNKIRDVCWRVFGKIFKTCFYIDNENDIEKEARGIIQALPNLRPYDFSIPINKTLITNLPKATPLSRIGIDVTIISPTNPDQLSKAAPNNNTIMRLRDGEKGKFVRVNGATNKLTGLTLSGDQIIGEMIKSNEVLIPMAVDPWGKFGDIFKHFLYGSKRPPPLLDYTSNATTATPHAIAMNKLATSKKTPSGILKTANKIWQNTNPNSWYGYSYMAPDPSTWAQQQIGLGITNALVHHIQRAITDIRKPSASSRRKFACARRSKTSPIVDVSTDSIPDMTPRIPVTHDVSPSQRDENTSPDLGIPTLDSTWRHPFPTNRDAHTYPHDFLD